MQQHSPDEFGLRVNVSDAILGQALVHAVEERPQQATHHPHQDKESKVHNCPQVAILISLWTLISSKFYHNITLTMNYNHLQRRHTDTGKMTELKSKKKKNTMIYLDISY